MLTAREGTLDELCVSGQSAFEPSTTTITVALAALDGDRNAGTGTRRPAGLDTVGARDA